MVEGYISGLWTSLCEYIIYKHWSQNTTRSPTVWLMLSRRRRRRPNINPTLGERVVFIG